MPLVRKSASESPGAAPPDPFTGLGSADAEQRWHAARTLGERPGGVEALGGAVARETDPRVREAMFMSLARAGTQAAAEAVAACLRADDATLRTGALDALCAMPMAAADLLPGLLDDADADVRLLACEIARVLPQPTGAELLCAVITRDSEVNVCAAAVEVLAEIGDDASLDALRRCAARFADAAFLGFAIRRVSERIARSRPSSAAPGPTGDRGA